MKMRYLKGWTSYNESTDNDSEANKFQYMMLGRLQTDCDYFLGNGQRSVNNLWGATIEEHIAEMKKIWNSLEAKPEWLSMEQIEDYERQMTESNGSETETETEGGIETASDVYNKYSEQYPLASDLIAWFIFGDSDTDLQREYKDKHYDLSELALSYETNWEDNMEDIENSINAIIA